MPDGAYCCTRYAAWAQNATTNAIGSGPPPHNRDCPNYPLWYRQLTGGYCCDGYARWVTAADSQRPHHGSDCPLT